MAVACSNDGRVVISPHHMARCFERASKLCLWGTGMLNHEKRQKGPYRVGRKVLRRRQRRKEVFTVSCAEIEMAIKWRYGSGRYCRPSTGCPSEALLHQSKLMGLSKWLICKEM